MTTRVNDSSDYKSIFAAAQAAAKIPAPAETLSAGSTLAVRDLVVSLDTVIAAVAAAPRTPVFVQVFADVVEIPASVNWSLPPLALIIVARRVVAQAGSLLQLDYRTSPDPTILLYAAEIEGPLSVQAFTPGSSSPQPVDLTQLDSLGVRVRLAGGGVEQTPLTSIPPEWLAFGGPLWMSFATNFEMASLLTESRPEVARGMLAWIYAAGSPSPLLRELALQSGALLAQLAVSKGSVRYVPALSASVYRESAAAFGDAAKQYESEYRFFSAQATSKEQWIASAMNMQKSYELTDAFNRQLVAQAEANLGAAEDAVRDMRVRFALARVPLLSRRARFEAGIEIWKRDQAISAAIGIITTVLAFGAAAGELAAGDPEGGAEAVKQTEAAANEGAKIAEAMAALTKVLEAGKEALEFVEKIRAASATIDVAAAAGAGEAPAFNDISAQAEWDVFRLEADDALQFAVDESIEGAGEYRQGLDELSIYGKALAATQASLIDTAQELARLRLQTEVSTRMTQVIADSIEKMKESEKPDQLMMHLLYARGQNVKRWLFIAVRNYARAYQYWALRPSSVSPSILASASKLVEDLATTQRDYEDALASFPAPPQKFGDGDDGVAVELTDARLLDELRTTGATQFTLDVGNSAFNGCDRVRISRVRVWLFGANGDTQVQIGTPGVYRDRLRSESFLFTSAPLQRFFQYHGSPESGAKIALDGAVADEHRFAFFEPTPFAQWTLAVNRDLNLSGLSKIVMTFAGSAIGRAVGTPLPAGVIA
jgi:hypothetical protein